MATRLLGVPLDRDSPRVRLSRVGDATFHTVLGWRDDEHVVVQRFGCAEPWVTWDSIDVTTGEMVQVAAGDARSQALPAVAQQAWQAPLLTDAPAPPSPLDPRLLLGLALLVGAAGVGGVVGWRPRVRL